MSKRVSVMLALFAATSLAASAFGSYGNITVDEWGNLTGINGYSGTVGLRVDPISGLTTLAYQLPYAGNPGDLLMISPNEPDGTDHSDLIRFTGDGYMYFFSLQEDVDDNAPADVPALPSVFQSSYTAIQELGLEGDNYGIWGAGTSNIGGEPGSPELTYTFISDEVPEPSTAMLALAGASFLFLRRRAK